MWNLNDPNPGISCPSTINEVGKIQIRTDCSFPSTIKENENTLMFLLESESHPSEKASQSISRTQEETESDTQFHETNSSESMCPPQELAFPIYIPTQSSESEGYNDISNLEDDDGSISSLDSYEKEDFPMPSQQKTKRPIFSKYWKVTDADEASSDNIRESKNNNSDNLDEDCNQASTSHNLSSCASEVPTSLPDEFAYQEFNRDFSSRYYQSSSDDVYEDILKVNELGRTTMPNATSLKEFKREIIPASEDSIRDTSSSNSLSAKKNNNTRTLFKNKYSQTSLSLSSYGYRDPSSRNNSRTSSSSSLKKKSRSCLRSRSCSVDSTALELSVSFDSKVFVHEYEKKLDRYTANGWSKWFV